LNLQSRSLCDPHNRRFAIPSHHFLRFARFAIVSASLCDVSQSFAIPSQALLQSKTAPLWKATQWLLKSRDANGFELHVNATQSL
jgi:hypothetical protein